MNIFHGNARAGILAGLLVAAVTGGALWFALRQAANDKPAGSEKNAFPYPDLKKYRHIADELFLYKEAGRFATCFKASVAVACGPGDRIYVAGAQAVRVFDEAGKRVSEFALPAAPRCLAVTGNGTVFVGFADRFEIYDAAGKRTGGSPALGPKVLLTSIAVAGDDVFLADYGNRVVLRCDRTGKIKRRLGLKEPGQTTGDFVIPSPYFDVAVSPPVTAGAAERLLWVADTGRHRLKAYTFAGKLQRSWGTSGTGLKSFCGCCNPANFALLPNGAFVTAEKGIARVKVYKADGSWSGAVAAPERFPEQVGGRAAGDLCCRRPGALDLAADSRGRVAVLVPWTNEVVVFKPLTAPEKTVKTAETPAIKSPSNKAGRDE